MSEFKPYPQFFLFGDSLLQQSNSYDDGFCFSAALQIRYERRLDVVNRGMSGYNTDQALKLIPNVIGSPENGRIKYLLLLFGANDACLESSSSGQHVPITRYQDNLKKIINHPKILAHDPKIIFCTPPPIDASRLLTVDEAGGITDIRREAETTAEYCKAAKSVAESELGDRGVVVDLWTAFMDNATQNTPKNEREKGVMLGSRSSGECKALVDLLHDGLHMTGKGYELFYDKVVKAMKQKWPEDNPKEMETVHPTWGVAFK